MRATISGTVQGVGFRWFVERELRALGVGGWVRNLRDRRVEAVVEGSEADVDRALELLRAGPPAAVVTEVAVEEIAGQNIAGFEIRH